MSAENSVVDILEIVQFMAWCSRLTFSLHVCLTKLQWHYAQKVEAKEMCHC